MFRVITVERELEAAPRKSPAKLPTASAGGSGTRPLTDEIAKVANVERSAVMYCDERLDSTFHRLAKTFWRGSYERSMPLKGAEPFDTDRFVAIGQEVMTRAAAAGNCVIVGRGAPYFLREQPDVFHVFLYAPRAEKLRRLRLIGHSEKEAEELVDTVDQDRIEFVKHYFGADWPTRCLYHMMINTTVGDENVISMILDSKHQLESTPLPRSEACLPPLTRS